MDLAGNLFLSLIRHTEMTHCQRGLHDTDPISWKEKYSNRRTYVYAAKSGTSTLRGHIDRWHIPEYLELVEARGWPIWLDSVKKALGLGYTITELRETIAMGGTLQKLGARTSATRQNDTALADGRRSVPSYSKEEFLRRLIAFIVADDQVCHFLILTLRFLAYSFSLSTLWNARNSASSCWSSGMTCVTQTSPIARASARKL